MKCSTCKEELQPKTEKTKFDIPGCSEHEIENSFSECPVCKTRYATPEQMLELARRYEEAERKFKK